MLSFTLTEELLSVPYEKTELALRLRVRNGEVSCLFGPDLSSLAPLGGPFPMVPGGWTGARPGFFCLSADGKPGGFADVLLARITEIPAP